MPHFTLRLGGCSIVAHDEHGSHCFHSSGEIVYENLDYDGVVKIQGVLKQATNSLFELGESQLAKGQPCPQNTAKS